MSAVTYSVCGFHEYISLTTCYANCLKMKVAVPSQTGCSWNPSWEERLQLSNIRSVFNDLELSFTSNIDLTDCSLASTRLSEHYMITGIYRDVLPLLNSRMPCLDLADRYSLTYSQLMPRPTATPSPTALPSPTMTPSVSPAVCNVNELNVIATENNRRSEATDTLGSDAATLSLSINAAQTARLQVYDGNTLCYQIDASNTTNSIRGYFDYKKELVLGMANQNDARHPHHDIFWGTYTADCNGIKAVPPFDQNNQFNGWSLKLTGDQVLLAITAGPNNCYATSSLNTNTEIIIANGCQMPQHQWVKKIVNINNPAPLISYRQYYVNVGNAVFPAPYHQNAILNFINTNDGSIVSSITHSVGYCNNQLTCNEVITSVEQHHSQSPLLYIGGISTVNAQPGGLFAITNIDTNPANFFSWSHIDRTDIPAAHNHIFAISAPITTTNGNEGRFVGETITATKIQALVGKIKPHLSTDFTELTGVSLSQAWVLDSGTLNCNAKAIQPHYREDAIYWVSIDCDNSRKYQFALCDDITKANTIAAQYGFSWIDAKANFRIRTFMERSILVRGVSTNNVDATIQRALLPITVDPSATPTATPNVSSTVSVTSTSTPSIAGTATSAITPSTSGSATSVVTPSTSSSETSAATPSVSSSGTSAATPSTSGTATLTVTPTVSSSATPSVSSSATSAVTPSTSGTATSVVTPSTSSSETSAATLSVSSSGTPAVTPSTSGTATLTVTPRVSGSATTALTPSTSSTVTSTATPSVSSSVAPVTTTPSTSSSRTSAATPSTSGTITSTATPSTSSSGTSAATPSTSGTVTSTATPRVSSSATSAITSSASSYATSAATPNISSSVAPTTTPSTSSSGTSTATPRVSSSATSVVTSSASSYATSVTTPSSSGSVTSAATPAVTPSGSSSAISAVTPSTSRSETSTTTPSISSSATWTVTTRASSSAISAVTPSASSYATAIASNDQFGQINSPAPSPLPPSNENNTVTLIIIISGLALLSIALLQLRRREENRRRLHAGPRPRLRVGRQPGEGEGAGEEQDAPQP